MDKVYMTLRGAQRLREELTRLKTTERPKIIAAIAEARAHGDLKENAEYHAAREQQGFCEGRISAIEAKLANAEVIDVAKAGATAAGKVIFGATVALMDEDSGAEVEYQIVGEDEADLKQNRISLGSPFARALIGKAEGETAEVQAPGGARHFEVVEVRYE